MDDVLVGVLPARVLYPQYYEDESVSCIQSVLTLSSGIFTDQPPSFSEESELRTLNITYLASQNTSQCFSYLRANISTMSVRGRCKACSDMTPDDVLSTQEVLEVFPASFLKT